MNNKLRFIHSLFVAAGLDAFKDKPAPRWMTNHPIFENKNTVEKIFPSVGIPNFTDPVNLTIDSTLEQDQLIEKLLNSLSDHISALEVKILKVSKSPNVDEEVSIKFLEFYELLRQTRRALYDADTIRRNGQTKIVLNENINFKNTICFRATDTIFKVFTKLETLHHNLREAYPQVKAFYTDKLPAIDSIPIVKEFHRTNISNKNYYVVFSGSGDESVWDIATMSMRGVSTCQHWSNEKYRSCLIGSILSKYVGIIYLTSGSQVEQYGSKMIKRCIVRFGVNTVDNEKVIILDQMYDSYDDKIAKLFIDSLEKRTNLKILNYAQFDKGELTNLPQIEDIEVPEEEELGALTPDEQPYFDFPFKNTTKNLQST